MAKRSDFIMGGVNIAAGSRLSFNLPAVRLYTHTELDIPVQVIHGRKDGPVLLVSAAIHGDELNGIEICRRLVQLPLLKYLRGTLVIVPIVNVFGFVHQSRYLPDRRDLNRCFPGREKGSLGGRIAHLVKSELLEKCTHAVDLHTGAIHRSNFPQIRAHHDDIASQEMAEYFSAPVILHTDIVEGSLRALAHSMNIPIIVYEAGEALRFDEASIKAGVTGVVNVMRGLDMLPKARSRSSKPKSQPFVARSSYWVRAERDGIIRNKVKLGQRVEQDEVLAIISSPFGEDELTLRAPDSGIIIGKNNIPLVNEGEALFHVARFRKISEAEKSIEAFRENVAVNDVLPADFGMVEN